MDICGESTGRFEIDPESGEPMGTFCFWKLIRLGCPINSSASAVGGDDQSINYLYRLVYPETPQKEVIGKNATRSPKISEHYIKFKRES